MLIYYFFCDRRSKMGVFIKKVKAFFGLPYVHWIARMMYYLLILLGLLMIYGFKMTNSSAYIYNEF
ncbi:teichoic acid D-Ala incorporation-associated protein DltX [Anoxybacteroides tepidamans]|uniref:teichoic acid D-Ala incorporation-associated protein DltX n=1 Tax=Anoxybacteroides tepidamans TaxID=265948 RepID=UPI002FBEBD04